MKRQIKRLSPHQSGKVIGLVMAVVTLPFVLLMALFGGLHGPMMGMHGGVGGPPLGAVLLLPLMNLLLGYLSTVVFCWVYNLMAGLVGGVELELDDMENQV